MLDIHIDHQSPLTIKLFIITKSVVKNTTNNPTYVKT